jgi:hypothetical protein
MDSSKFFPSNWLKAEDVGEQRKTVTIKNALEEEIGGDQKLVIYFEEMDKGLVLNRTNYERLNDEWGTETSKWTGKQVELYTAMVTYKKKEVPAIRLSTVVPVPTQ